MVTGGSGNNKNKEKEYIMRWTSLSAVVAAMVSLCAGQAQAEDMQTGRLNLYPSLYGDSAIELAANDTGTMTDASDPHANFEEPFITANKLHGYVGVLSLASALAAGMTAPEGGPVGQTTKNTFHHRAATTAAALGGAAVVSGLLLHADDLTPDFFDPDTAHMILGILGTAAYVYTLSKGPKVFGQNAGNHAGAGMAGAALMATAIYLEF